MPQPSTVKLHADLRSRLKLPVPAGSARLLYRSMARHHGYIEFSVIAWRQRNGRWQVDAVGESKGPFIENPVTPLPREMFELSDQKSRRLDALLIDPCLYAAPTFMRNPNIVAGGALQALEVEKDGARRVWSWFELRTQEQEEVTSLLVRD